MTRKSQPSGLRGWRLATRNPIAAHGTPMTSATTPSPSRWANTDSGIMRRERRHGDTAEHDGPALAAHDGQRRAGSFRERYRAAPGPAGDAEIHVATNLPAEVPI